MEERDRRAVKDKEGRGKTKKRNGKDIMHLKIKKGDKRFQGFCLCMNTKHRMNRVTIKSILQQRQCIAEGSPPVMG